MEAKIVFFICPGPKKWSKYHLETMTIRGQYFEFFFQFLKMNHSRVKCVCMYVCGEPTKIENIFQKFSEVNKTELFLF